MKSYTAEEVAGRRRKDIDDGQWVPADVAQGLYDALDRITNAGAWYNSALEIANHEDGYELESMARAALAAADGDEQ